MTDKIKIKCSSCETEWSGLRKFADVKKCPFCGEELYKREYKLTENSTMGEVLLYIKSYFGEEIFYDKPKLLAIFSDLVPKMKKEYRILSFSLSEICLEKYFIGITAENYEINIMKARNALEPFMTDFAINIILQALIEAFEWNINISGDKTAENYSDENILKNAYLAYENKEYKKSFLLYKQSADKGNAEGMLWTGAFYYNGIGISKSYHEAYKWYKKSAELGNAEGMCQTGNCYYNGIGVKRNEREAYKWYKKSAELGNEDAKAVLDNMPVYLDD